MKTSPIFRFMEEYYRAKETANISLRLGEVVGDILYSTVLFCEKNKIPMDEGILRLVTEAEGLANRIANINSMPLQELLKKPSERLRSSDDNLQDDNPTGSGQNQYHSKYP